MAYIDFHIDTLMMYFHGYEGQSLYESDKMVDLKRMKEANCYAQFFATFFPPEDHMDISDASMLDKLSPFFAVVFSALLLKEKANKYEWGAVIAAFIGMLFVVRPSFDIKVVPALAGVAGGLGAGIAYTFVRKLGTRGENSMIVVAFFSGFTTMLLIPNMLFNYKPMTPIQWMFLVLTGLAAAGGQIGITSAYACAPAKEISVYDFSIVIFAAIFGFAFLGQIPDYLSVVGYIIIIGTALLKWYYTVVKPAKAENT